MSEHRPIIMRCNRSLGAALVEANLITVEQLEDANEKLLHIMEKGSDKEICLLDILLHQTNALTIEDLFNHLVEERRVALLDPREIEINDDLKLSLTPGECWATWSVPFDRDEDVVSIVSAYAVCPAVRQHWEKRFGGTIVWFAATLDAVGDFLDKFEAERAGISGAARTAA